MSPTAMTKKAKKQVKKTTDGAPLQTCGKCETTKPSRAGKNDSWALPNGWTRLGDEIVCRECKKREFVTRGISLTVSRVEFDGQPAWDQFRAVFRPAERAVVRLANWAISELAVQDPARQLPYTGEPKQKMPKFKVPYLYGDPRSAAIANGMYAATRREVLTTARKLYMKHRFGIFLGKESVPTFRSPAPVPFGKDGRIGESEGRFYALLTIGGVRFKLWFAGGHRHRRQLKTLQRILAGEVIARTFSLHDLSAGRTQHRPLINKGKRLVCKIAVLLPKTQHPVDPGRILYVNTGNKVMLRYGCADEIHRRLVFNADHVRRRRHAHRERLNRLMDDKKRYPRGERARRDIDTKLAQICERQNRWLSDFCHKTSRMLIDFAIRSRVGRIEFDGSRKGFIAEFPWFKLATLVEEKAVAANIKFISSSAEVSDTPDPLAINLNPDAMSSSQGSVTTTPSAEQGRIV